jgi:hypothetical protein
MKDKFWNFYYFPRLWMCACAILSDIGEIMKASWLLFFGMASDQEDACMQRMAETNPLQAFKVISVIIVKLVFGKSFCDERNSSSHTVGFRSVPEKVSAKSKSRAYQPSIHGARCVARTFETSCIQNPMCATTFCVMLRSVSIVCLTHVTE